MGCDPTKLDPPKKKVWDPKILWGDPKVGPQNGNPNICGVTLKRDPKIYGVTLKWDPKIYGVIPKSEPSIYGL